MSTGPEVPTTPPAGRPFYRRPTVLILAAAIVVILVLGGVIVSLVLGRTGSPTRIADASTTAQPSTPVAAPSIQPTASPTVVTTPTPVPSKSKGAVKPPAAPPVAKPPAAPPPATGAGPGRGTTVAIQSLTAVIPRCPNPTYPVGVLATFTWASTGGTTWLLSDQLGYINQPGHAPIVLKGASGTGQYVAPCNASPDVITLTVKTSTFPVKSATKSITVYSVPS